MKPSAEFFLAILDSLTEHIVDGSGVIRFANAAWNRFGAANGSSVSKQWSGISYLEAFDAAAAKGEDDGRLGRSARS